MTPIGRLDLELQAHIHMLGYFCMEYYFNTREFVLDGRLERLHYSKVIFNAFFSIFKGGLENSNYKPSIPSIFLP